MAYSLTKEQQDERNTLLTQLQKAGKALSDAVETYNQTITTAWEAVEGAQQQFNAEIAKAQDFIDEVHDTFRGEFENEDEDEQEGETGQAIGAWLEEWSLQLDESDIESHEPIETPSNDSADAFEELPVEPTA